MCDTLRRMKTAGWLAIIVSAILFVAILMGMNADVHDAITTGRSVEVQESRNTQWMIEGIGGAVFLVAGIAMINSGKKQTST